MPASCHPLFSFHPHFILSTGTEAPLHTQAAIEIADSGQIYFLLPKAKQPIPQKPKLTYEQLVTQVQRQ